MSLRSLDQTPDRHFLVRQVETAHVMAEETRVEGNVSRHIYLKYFTAGCNVLVLVAMALLSVVAEVNLGSRASHSHLNCSLPHTGVHPLTI